MDIQTEKDITPEVALSLRKARGMTQFKFWDSVGSNQGSGTLFENNKRNSIPRPIRILIFLKYVCGLPVGASNQAQAEISMRYGREIAARIEAEQAKADAIAEAERAAAEAKRAAKIASDAEKKAKQLTA